MKTTKGHPTYLWMSFVIIFFSKCARTHCPDDVVTPSNPSSSHEIASWKIKNSGITGNLLSVSTTSESTVYMCGTGGVIYKTTDSCNSTTLLNSGTTQNLYTIWFLDSNTGIAAGDGSIILRTTDAGVNWIPVSSPLGTNYREIFFLDSNIGFIVGGGGSMIKTINGGLNWTAMTLPTAVDLLGVFFTDINTGYISGQQYTMLKTIDGGANWNFVNTGLTYGTTVTPLTSIFFTSADTGYAVGGRVYPTGTSENAIIKTTDAGATWVKQLNPDNTNAFISVKFANSNVGYIAGRDIPNNTGLVLKTTNGGANWSVQATFPLQMLSDIDLCSSGRGYAVGHNGAALKGEFK